jgi:nitrite reductase (NADH) small subunit
MAGTISSDAALASDHKIQISIGRVHLIPRGQGRCFSIGRFRVAVFRSRDDTVAALENACPHQGGPLADGIIGAGSVVCPLHAHQFSLADGRGIDTDLSTRMFPAEIRDGFIFVELPSDA